MLLDLRWKVRAKLRFLNTLARVRPQNGPRPGPPTDRPVHYRLTGHGSAARSLAHSRRLTVSRDRPDPPLPPLFSTDYRLTGHTSAANPGLGSPPTVLLFTPINRTYFVLAPLRPGFFCSCRLTGHTSLTPRHPPLPFARALRSRLDTARPKEWSSVHAD